MTASWNIWLERLLQLYIDGVAVTFYGGIWVVHLGLRDIKRGVTAFKIAIFAYFALFLSSLVWPIGVPMLIYSDYKRRAKQHEGLNND
jgi:hypothetical protein